MRARWLCDALFLFVDTPFGYAPRFDMKGSRCRVSVMLKRRRFARLFSQLTQHSVALISLLVAVLALTLNTERANTSEHQRTTRDASFRVLFELSQLQLLVDEAHYGSAEQRRQPISGWARVNYMRDLATLIPEPAPEALESLYVTWGQQVGRLGELADPEASLQANVAISDGVQRARVSVKRVLIELD